jgi:hypothetical protein
VEISKKIWTARFKQAEADLKRCRHARNRERVRDLKKLCLHWGAEPVKPCPHCGKEQP